MILDVLNRENWIKRRSATDINGIMVEISNPRACCFCLLGAIFKAYKNHDDQMRVISVLAKRVNNIAIWNDAVPRTWEDVEKLIKEAGV